MRAICNGFYIEQIDILIRWPTDLAQRAKYIPNYRIVQLLYSTMYIYLLFIFERLSALNVNRRCDVFILFFSPSTLHKDHVVTSTQKWLYTCSFVLFYGDCHTKENLTCWSYLICWSYGLWQEILTVVYETIRQKLLVSQEKYSYKHFSVIFVTK